MAKPMEDVRVLEVALYAYVPSAGAILSDSSLLASAMWAVQPVHRGDWPDIGRLKESRAIL